MIEVRTIAYNKDDASSGLTVSRMFWSWPKAVISKLLGVQGACYDLKHMYLIIYLFFFIHSFLNWHSQEKHTVKIRDNLN